MATAYAYRERNSGGTPRSLLTPTTTVDFGSAPTGIVVVLFGADAVFDGCKVGGTAGATDGTGYSSGTLTLTDTTVSGSGLRVYKYFGAGIPTGAQPIHFSKTTGDANVSGTVIVFDGGETDIGTPTIHTGVIGGSFSLTKSSTTTGRTVLAAGIVDLGGGNTVTGTSGTTANLSSNGTYVGHGVVMSKTAAGSSTTLNGNSAGSSFFLAAFEVVAGSGGSGKFPLANGGLAQSPLTQGRLVA